MRRAVVRTSRGRFDNCLVVHVRYTRLPALRLPKVESRKSMNENASLASSTPRSALGGLPQRLVQDGVVEEAAMMEALNATKDGSSIVTQLVKSGAANARDIAIAASSEFGVPLFDLDASNLDPETIRLVNEKLLAKHRVLPVFRRGKRLFLAVADPTNLHAIDEIKFQTGMGVEAVVVEDDKLQKAVDKAIEQADMGLACSAIAALARDKDYEIKRRAKLDMHKGSKFVAEVGARIEFDVTLEWTFTFEGNFGPVTLYKFIDADGNLLVWFASNSFCPGPVSPDNFEPNEEIAVGQRVKIKGTVKKHEERDGIKQTVLSRVAESLTKAEKKARKEEFQAKTFEYYARMGYCTRCYAGILTHMGAPESAGCFACEGSGHQDYRSGYEDNRAYAKPGAYYPLPQSYPLVLQFAEDSARAELCA